MDEDFEMPPVGGMNDDDMDFGDAASFLKVGEEKEIQGLKKKLVKEGEGYETPENGDEVEVYYTGTSLDGTEFHCSRDSGKPFKFTIGRGQVIKGWEISMKTMKKGENAVFTIPSQLVYGESGALPKIPRNVTFQLDVELLTWVSVKDICKDVTKKILAVGEKWENPKDLDEVLVKYEAKLEDGTVVGKSDGVEFRVNDGYFCPALAKAVKTMKKGEKVLLTVKPQYGFGEKGKLASAAEGAVPPSATLVINLELVSWKTVSEVTDDNKVMKKILKEGEGYERPNKGSVVKVKLLGKLQDGTIFLKKGHGESEEPFQFKTDEEQVIDGLDRAVMKMKKGEVALVTIEPEYAFGSTGSLQELAVVPPNSTVNYEVDLVTFEKERELWDMNTEEKIEAAGKKKEEGNAKFKAGKYALASKRYEKAVKFIEYETSFSEEEKKQAKALKVACNLKDVACKLKLKDYKQAEKLCTKVLELESTNVKAFFVLVKAIPAMSSEEELEREVQLYIAQDSNQKFNALLEKIWKRIPKSTSDTVPDTLKFLCPYHAFFKNTHEQMDDSRHYLSDIMSVLDFGEMEYLDQVDFPKIRAKPITELTLKELKMELRNRGLEFSGRKEAMKMRLAYSIRMEENGYFKKVRGKPIFKLEVIEMESELRLRLFRSSGINREELALRLAKAVNSDIKISEDENSLEKSLNPVQIDREKLSDSFQVVFLDLEFKLHTILEVGIVLVDLVTWKMDEFQAILRQSKEFMKSYVGRSSIPRIELEANSSPRFRDIYQTIFDCLHKRVVIGHNIKACDLGVIRNRFFDLGLEVPEPRAVIDTYEWINDNNLGELYPHKKLEDLADKFKLARQTHRALEDCYLNIEVFKILLASKQLRERFLDGSTDTENTKTRKSKRSKSSR